MLHAVIHGKSSRWLKDAKKKFLLNLKVTINAYHEKMKLHLLFLES